jgi:hypothetical protein
MAVMVLYKRPTVSLDAEAWEDLASRLREINPDVRREDRYMEPGRVGIIFGEFIVLYFGYKVIDVATDHAIEAMLTRIVETVKVWGRERFGGRSDSPRARPLTVQIVDEGGNVIRTWTIDKDGERNVVRGDDDPIINDPAVNVHEEVPATWDAAEGREEPKVLLSLRSTHEGRHLRVDAFVAGEHRLVADLTRIPARVAVSPSPGHLVTAVIDTNDDDELTVSAEGYRCELIETGNGDLLAFLYANPE